MNVLWCKTGHMDVLCGLDRGFINLDSMLVVNENVLDKHLHHL